MLETVDRNMELYAPTRMDRDKWVKMFKLIVEMNQNHISTTTMSPFVYDMQRKYLVKNDEEIEIDVL